MILIFITCLNCSFSIFQMYLLNFFISKFRYQYFIYKQESIFKKYSMIAKNIKHAK